MHLQCNYDVKTGSEAKQEILQPSRVDKSAKTQIEATFNPPVNNVKKNCRFGMMAENERSVTGSVKTLCEAESCWKSPSLKF